MFVKALQATSCSCAVMALFWAAPSEATVFLALFDRDGNGSIDTYEGAEAWLWFAAEADRNGDGRLDQAEIEGYLEDHQDRAGLEQELRAWIAEFDVDGDGVATRDELPEETRDAWRELSMFDSDEDGRIHAEEILEFLTLEREEAATFEVREDPSTAYLNGVLSASTPGRVLELALEHPQVERIVMEDVPGSMDDEANLRAALLVHRLGYATHVPQGGMVASGGTDFFLAGAKRSVEKGARVGVHTWAGPEGPGSEVPRDHPEHRKYLDYYRAVGVPEAFYWYTLEAASADDVHWMTPEEMRRYGIVIDDQ